MSRESKFFLAVFVVIVSISFIGTQNAHAQVDKLSPILAGVQLNLVKPKIEGMEDVFERKAGFGLFGSANMASLIPVQIPMIEPKAGLYWGRVKHEAVTADFSATTTFSPLTVFLEPSYELPIPRETAAGVGGRAFVRLGYGFSRTTIETSYDAIPLLLGRTYGGGSSSAKDISSTFMFGIGLAFDYAAVDMLELIFDYSFFRVFQSQSSNYNQFSFGVAYKI